MTQTRIPGQKARTQGPPRRTSGGPRAGSRVSVRLTGRGGVVALFAVCFLSLLLAAWTGWAVFAAVVFVMTCGLVACYTRPAGLRGVVVCPPLAFCTGSVLAQLITAPDAFSALAGVLITLGTSTLWLFTGTALTMAIALGRGWRPELPATVLGNLRVALRERRPRGERWVERRLTVQDLEFLPPVRIGDHRDRQVGVPGQLDGQVAKPAGLEPLGLLPDPVRCGAA